MYVCSVRTGTPLGKFEAPMPIPLCKKIKPIKLPLPSKVLQHYPNSKEETFMVGFQKPSCWCCFNRKQKPQFMRTIFVSTVNDKLLLIYDKEKNKGKKKKSGASTKREGYSFQLSSAISMEIKKNALISKVSKYTNQDEHHCILEISFKFGMCFIGMDGEKIISEWCPVILCAFSPLLVPPTPASCDVLISGTNITTKNTSKAALDANKQIEKAKPLSAEIVDSSLPPPPVEEHHEDVSQDVTRKSAISKNNEQKQQKGDRMERWFSNNSEDTSKLSVDDKEAASGPMPTESPKKLSDTSLTEIGPPLATSSLADVNSTNNDNFNSHQHEEFIFSRITSHNDNDEPSMAIQRQQPATKAQQYLLKQQQNRFCNYTSNNSSYIPMNENKEEGSYSITSCISTSEQRTSPEPDCGYQFTWVPKHLSEEEIMIVKEEIEKKTKQLASRQFIGEPSNIEHVSKTTYHCSKPSFVVETPKEASKQWRPDALIEHQSRNKSVPTTQEVKDVPPQSCSHLDDTLQRPFPLQKAKKVTTISPNAGGVNKTPKQVRWLSPRREFNDIPRPYQVAPIRQASSSLGYIVRRYGFNDDIIGSGCVYDGGDNSTKLQHFGPLGSEVAIREHGREKSDHSHHLVNVRKLFEQRITAYLDKNSSEAINGNNLAAIGPVKDTLEPTAASFALNNKKSKMETNDCKLPNETEMKNNNNQKCWPPQQKSSIPEKHPVRQPPPPPPLLFRTHIPTTRVLMEQTELKDKEFSKYFSQIKEENLERSLLLTLEEEFYKLSKSLTLRQIRSIQLSIQSELFQRLLLLENEDLNEDILSIDQFTFILSSYPDRIYNFVGRTGGEFASSTICTFENNLLEALIKVLLNGNFNVELFAKIIFNYSIEFFDRFLSKIIFEEDSYYSLQRIFTFDKIEKRKREAILISKEMRLSIRDDLTNSLINVFPRLLEQSEISRRQIGMFTAETIFNLFEHPSPLKFDYIRTDPILCDFTNALKGKENEKMEEGDKKSEEKPQFSLFQQKNHVIDPRVSILDSDDDEEENIPILIKNIKINEEKQSSSFPYIQDCLVALKDEKTEFKHWEEALLSIGPLIKKKSIGLNILGIQILETLIFLEERFKIDNFRNIKIKIISFLLADNPQLISHFNRLFCSKRCSQSHKFLIISSIVNAAKLLYYGDENIKKEENEKELKEKKENKQIGKIIWRSTNLNLKQQTIKTSKFAPVASQFIFSLLDLCQKYSFDEKDFNILANLIGALGEVINISKFSPSIIRIAK
uniref:Telomere length regulation protein conserved domain-containing protein n=1 Tax=Meloidogyne javanica TaxID=6303 RepID=A0A915LID7_MELJA